MDAQLPRMTLDADPISFQDLLEEPPTSTAVDSSPPSTAISDERRNSTPGPDVELNTPVSSPLGSDNSQEDTAAVSHNQDTVTNHSDLLAEAVRQILSPAPDTSASHSYQEQLTVNSDPETASSTEHQYANASFLAQKLHVCNLQLHNQRITIINLQDELLDLKRTLSACQTDKVNWQLSASLYEQDLLLKRYNITIANKMQFAQNEKLALAHRFIDVQTAQISTLSRQLCQLQINYENLRHELRLLQAQYL
jgi:hypothetical protein